MIFGLSVIEEVGKPNGFIIYRSQSLIIEEGVSWELIRVALHGIDLCGDLRQSPIIDTTFKFECHIGVDSCVSTTPEDDIVYGRAREDDNWQRYVRNRQPEETPLLTVSLHLRGLGLIPYPDPGFVLDEVHFGKWRELEPYETGDPNAEFDDDNYNIRSQQRKLAFWANHAFVLPEDSPPFAETTTECPWSTLT